MFKSNSHDLVIACEVFEHLNFNPIPVIAEVNRILKVDGYFYLAMPNSSAFINRLRFLFTGIHPTFSIQELFLQLNPNKNKIVSLHWREYSMSEAIKMITPLGFSLEKSKLTTDTTSKSGNFLKRTIRNTINSLPGCGNTQVLIFKKIKDNQLNFVVNQDS